MLAADLHVHLDGSLRAATLAELARERGLYPSRTPDARIESDLVFGEGMTLSACLRRFEVTVGLLQNAAALRRVAAELIEDCYSDGVRHAEIRMSPLLHTREGLDADGALEAVLEGIDRGTASLTAGGRREWMSGRVVIAVLEGMTDAEASLTVDLAIRNSGSGVVGVDLAGDESLFSEGRFESQFRLAREAGLGVTVHAGESGGPEHVAASVDTLGADRIGHGTSAARDPRVLELLAERNVTVECCLSSNVHTGAVPRYEEHPLPRLIEAGVPVALATDNRFFSRTSLSREYDIAGARLGVSRRALERVAMASGASSFLTPKERTELEGLIAASIEAATGSGESGGDTASGPHRAREREV